MGAQVHVLDLIRTLGDRWNVRVMSVSQLGVVAAGPYRWVRHPNYTAVFVEMLALPLIGPNDTYEGAVGIFWPRDAELE